MFRLNFQQHSNIIFISDSTNESPSFGRPKMFFYKNNNTEKDKSDNQFIYLLSDTINFNILQNAPRLFTITTNNSSAKFNTEILANTSSIIDKFISENIDIFQYHLDIKDEENIISKFEKMYLGEKVEFDEDEFPVVRKITKALNLTNCPDFMIHKDLKKKSFSTFGSKFDRNSDLTVKISKNSLESYFTSKSLQNFTIHTKKNEYKCCIFGILSSSIIRDLIFKDSKINQYFYDYEDEEGEFKLICNFFNFKKVKLTRDNVFIIQDICKDLKIDFLMDLIDQYIVDTEKVSKAIDDKQNIINIIDNLFDLLYSIRNKSVNSVASIIKESKWVKTEESVNELSAFILQVVQVSIQLHSYMIELLLELDEGSKDVKNLKFLLPFVIKHSLNRLNSDNDDPEKINLINPFVYNLFKRGLVTKVQLLSKFQLLNKNPFFVSWFLPELLENKKLSQFQFRNNILNRIEINQQHPKNKKADIITLYYPCDSTKMKEYKEMRDMFECDDVLAKALRNDDVDTFQSLISQSGYKISKLTVQKNMFEPFFKENMRYINYAAAYGSIRCFKYLLLNDEKIDELTFQYSVFGGNNELIRIVDNLEADPNNFNNKTNRNMNMMLVHQNTNNNKYENALIYSISMHRNDLFDWILEQKNSLLKNNEVLLKLANCSIQNGNAHSLVQLIDNNFNFQNYSNKFPQFLATASEKGFYLLVNLLYNLTNKDTDQKISLDPKIAVKYGNVLIFKLFADMFDQKELNSALLLAIRDNSVSIIEYFFENLINHNFTLDANNSIDILVYSIQNNSEKVINYVIEKVNSILPIKQMRVDNIFKLLMELIQVKNIENSIKFIDIIYQNNPNNEFTKSVVFAAKKNLKEIIEYIIDHKYFIDFNEVAECSRSFGCLNVDIFTYLTSFMNDNQKKKMFNHYCLNSAISQKNKSLAKFLLNENVSADNSLITAIDSQDLEFVEMILEKIHKPSNINSCYQNELIKAIDINNLPIFKKLLSIPGINPNVFGKNYRTPLIIVISKFKVNFLKIILDFYGEDIKNQKWQIEKGISSIVDLISPKDDENSKKNVTLSQNLIDSIYDILRIILDLNIIDPNYRFQENTLLTFACKTKSIKIVKLLLQIDEIDPNIYSPDSGDSPLIIAIKNLSFDIVKLLIDCPKTNINQKNMDGKSPLLISIETKKYKIANLLLDCDRFDPEESKLNYAFLIGDFEISSKLLTFKSLDVNYTIYIDNSIKYHNGYASNNKNVCQEKYAYTPKLISATINSQYDLIDSIIQHPSFDKNSPIYLNAIQIALFNENIKILQILFQKDEDLIINCTINEENNYFLVDLLIESTNEKLASCILSYPKYNSDGSFISLKIDQNGFSDQKFIHSDSIFYNTLIEFMINHGYDPNKPDKYGFYPLVESIVNQIFYLFDTLIKSDKIDINQKIPDQYGDSKFTTYLHIAVRVGNYRAFKEILQKESADINVTNDLGDTPLIEACRNKRIQIINTIKNIENIDFLHKNNKGEDALQIAKNETQKSSDIAESAENINRADKNVYFQELFKYFRGEKTSTFTFPFG